MTATMLGRQVSSLLRQPLQARLAAATTSQCLCIRTLSTSSTFAGAAASKPASKPGRPKKAVGEPSRPVKRAVKRAAKKPASESSEPAAKKVAAKKNSASTKKKVAAKPKPKPAPKKRTPEQLARIKEKRAKLEKKELVAAALSPPKLSQPTAFTQYLKSKAPELKQKIEQAKAEGKIARDVIGEFSKEAAAAWKERTPADIEHFNHLRHTAKEANRAEYKRWIESHTPEEIRVANLARKALRRREDLAKGHLTKWPDLIDERTVTRTANAFVQFSVNRHASGDFSNISIGQRSKLIAQEWKALDATEKEKYHNLAKADLKRYVDEHTTVYGVPPAHVATSQRAAAAA